MDSSPFIERPANILGDEELLKKVNELSFQLKDMKNQLNIANLESEDKINTLNKKLLEQQTKNDAITSDQIYLYNQNKELNNKISHINDNNEVVKKKYEQEIEHLKNKLYEYQSSKDDEEGDKYEISSLNQEVEQLNEKNIGLCDINDQLTEELDEKYSEITRLKSIINDKDDQLEELKLKLRTIPSTEEIESVSVIKSQLSEQVSYLKDLESKNLSQAEQIKKLTLNKENINILKEENNDLNFKLKKLNELNDEINDLNLENISLKQELSKFKVYFSDDVNIEELLKTFRLNKDENIILQNNLNELELNLKSEKVKYNELFLSHQSLLKNNDEINLKYESLLKLNNELKQQIQLSFEESKLLRIELKEFDKQKNDDYIKNLESLVDQYKQKVDLSATPSHKRKREDDDTTSKTFQNEIIQLQQDKFNLKNQLLKLSNENTLLVKKIESLTSLKEEKLRILQLRSSPFNSDQLVKQKQLDLLKKQNEDLLSKATDEMIPKSVYDYLKFENSQLEKKIEQSNKKSQRLKEIYSSKSLELINLINSLFGYKFELLPQNKIKIISKFINNDENCLIIDIYKKTFKLIKIDEQDDKFFEICENLLKFWITEKNEIPCFLSALNLELFDNKQLE